MTNTNTAREDELWEAIGLAEAAFEAEDEQTSEAAISWFRAHVARVRAGGVTGRKEEGTRG